MLYTPPMTGVSCKAEFVGGRPYTTLVVPGGDFTGTVRLAILNNCTTGTVPPSPHCEAEGLANENMEPFSKALDQGSNACPVRGSVGTPSP